MVPDKGAVVRVECFEVFWLVRDPEIMLPVEDLAFVVAIELLLGPAGRLVVTVVVDST